MARKNKYDISENLSAENAILAATNMFMDAAQEADRRGDTDTLMEAGDRLLRIGLALMEQSSEDGASIVSDSEKADEDETREKVKIGFTS